MWCLLNYWSLSQCKNNNSCYKAVVHSNCDINYLKRAHWPWPWSHQSEDMTVTQKEQELHRASPPQRTIPSCRWWTGRENDPVSPTLWLPSLNGGSPLSSEAENGQMDSPFTAGLPLSAHFNLSNTKRLTEWPKENRWIFYEMQLQEAPFLFINWIEGTMPHRVTPGINSIKWTNSHCVPAWTRGVMPMHC